MVTGWSNNIIQDPNGYGLKMESVVSSLSPYVLKRTVNVAGGYPAVLIQDTATGSTSPIAVQIEQEDDGTFINMKKGGVSKFDVSTAGAVTAASTVTTTGITSSGAISDTRSAVALTDGATIAVDASQGSVFTCALGGSRTISAPSNATNNQIITLRLGNNTAGAIVTTWAAGWIMSTWTDPAAGKYRTISFVYVSSSGNWWEIGRTAADI